MIVELITNEEGHAIGWSMTGDTPEEIKKLGTIRDLQFWGFDDNGVDYAGRTNSDDKNRNPGTLNWKQRKYIKHG
jgi:hypothetical protein